MSIKVSNITKLYGEQKALDAVSFSLKEGQIVGFLGPNGAGKSTMMKIITGYIKPSDGKVEVVNLPIDTNRIKCQKKIGYLPEHNPLYVDMYVKEYLNFNASIYKISKLEVDKVIKLVGLEAEKGKKIKQLSKGYRQRVGLAAALLHNPEVLILDEPTTGLDPNQLVEIRGLIKQLGKNKTVLLSTHIMQEVEAICDRVIILNKGKIVADKLLSELKQNETQLLEVTFDLKIEPQFLQKLPNLKQVVNIFDTTWQLTFTNAKDMRSTLFDFAKENGLKILELNSKNKNLETLFTELTT